ncbi:hypothetical protein SAMN04488057_11954 [Cyclobacterium lianum]|uniref:Uncharacterized protein n=1 Tax=Cyclobacterium lianum TaxID=388280 RepID=A0A1M7QK23_9BACT|nr:hypothetical protein [Cyclobacterium lianum]SHN31639.1 hypothetical protein SAMN04488057_11954 [Cyclobacterium lianum]
MSDLKKKWLIFAVSGLLLMGSGLSIFGESLLLKWDEQPFTDWFLWGTASLVVFNAGVSLFGKAVIYRFRMENEVKR